MYSIIKKEDVRSRNTENMLFSAAQTLLERNNFKKITVKSLCEEAKISRATFYTHFIDKYDLLKYFLSAIREDTVKDVYNYDELEREVNLFIASNKKIIANVLKEANSETLMLIREFMESIVILTLKRNIRDSESPNHIILINFFIGGLVNLLTWIVENNFPPEVSMVNKYMYKMLEAMTIWDAEQEHGEAAT